MLVYAGICYLVRGYGNVQLGEEEMRSLYRQALRGHEDEEGNVSGVLIQFNCGGEAAVPPTAARKYKLIS